MDEIYFSTLSDYLWSLQILVLEVHVNTMLVMWTLLLNCHIIKKDTFFHKLPNVAEQLPCQIVLKRQLPPLLACALEFGYGASPGLTAMLKMGSSLSSEEFSVKVLPAIVKLFSSNNHAIRARLAQDMESHCQHKLLMSKLMKSLQLEQIPPYYLGISQATWMKGFKVDCIVTDDTDVTTFLMVGKIVTYLALLPTIMSMIKGLLIPFHL
uniref:Uncharacterized protein n=1 Tax=Salix viminalis TaxID=40686 RepID=A0A6N2N2X3_SALVM